MFDTENTFYSSPCSGSSWFLDELILSVWHPCLTVEVLWSADTDTSRCESFELWSVFHLWSFNLVLRNEMQATLCEMLLNQEARLSADRDSTVRGWMRFKASRKTLGSLLCLRLGWQAIQIFTPTFRKSFCCPLYSPWAVIKTSTHSARQNLASRPWWTTTCLRCQQSQLLIYGCKQLIPVGLYHYLLWGQ